MVGALEGVAGGLVGVTGALVGALEGVTGGLVGATGDLVGALEGVTGDLVGEFVGDGSGPMGEATSLVFDSSVFFALVGLLH